MMGWRAGAPRQRACCAFCSAGAPCCPGPRRASRQRPRLLLHTPACSALSHPSAAVLARRQPGCPTRAAALAEGTAAPPPPHAAARHAAGAASLLSSRKLLLRQLLLIPPRQNCRCKRKPTAVLPALAPPLRRCLPPAAAARSGRLLAGQGCCCLYCCAARLGAPHSCSSFSVSQAAGCPCTTLRLRTCARCLPLRCPSELLLGVACWWVPADPGAALPLRSCAAALLLQLLPLRRLVAPVWRRDACTRAPRPARPPPAPPTLACPPLPAHRTWENVSNSCASVTSRSKSPTYRLELAWGWAGAAAGAGAAGATSI